MKKKDLTGLKFGRLTVVEQSSQRSKGKRIMWNCICECGNRNTITGKDLLNGNTKSCGCYANEIRGFKNKKYTLFDISGNFGIGHINSDCVFYFDIEDYDKIKEYYWTIRNGYVATRKTKNKNSEIIYLHRAILGLNRNDNLMADHINHDKLDNQKSNLRIVTLAENNINTKLSKNNKTGIIGVSYNKYNGKWDVRLGVNKKVLIAKSFYNFEEAVICRLCGEKEFYGDLSPQKNLFKKYNI